MTLTSHRIIQYLAILLILTLGGGGYWYWKNAQAAVTQKAASKTGLVGYWSFDEGSGTSAGDASGNSNTGTLTNSPTWTSGKLGQGLLFNTGATNSQYVSVPATIDDGITNGLTLSAWINPEGLSGGREIIRNDDGNGNRGFYIRTTGSNAEVYVYNGGIRSVVGSVALSTGTWSHIVGTYDGTTLKLYVNGVQDGSLSTSGNITLSSTSLYIGSGVYQGFGAGSQGEFRGKIDEARIYNRALGATEITNLYNLGAAKLNTSQNTSITSGLVGEWSFNGPDISGTTAYDRSGSGNNGTLTNGPTATIGKVGQAMSFDGADDYVAVADSNSLDITNTLTIASWIKPTSVSPSGDKSIVRKEGLDYQDNYSLILGGGFDAASGNLGFVYNSSGWRVIDSGYTLPDTQWHHVAVTFNYANTELLFYVDGLLVSTKTIAANLTTNTNALNIGMDVNNKYFNGSIDEVRIYNRALSAAEIQTLYALGDADKVNSSASQPQGTGRLDSGLAGYWKLDENTGTSASDASTNSNTGTLTNSPTWTTGQIGSAVTFNGSNQYMTVSGPTFASSGAISFWIYPSSFSGSRYVFDSTNNRYLFYQNNGSTGAWVWYLNGASIATNISLPINTSEWHHVTLTWDNGLSSDKEKIFVNGNQVVSFNVTVGSSQPSSMYIGSRQSFSEIWNGSIDEIRIYNRALAADEVKQLYRTTVPTSVDTSLKGYWSFNGQDVSGTTAYDRSGAGNNGTLTSSPTAAIGKAGQALSFNGTTSFVDLGAPTALDLSGVNKFTLSAWVYPTATPNGAGVITEMYTSTVQYTIGFSNNVTPTGNSYPTVGFYNGAWRAITESRAIDLNQWSLITGTWDGTTMNLYRNGALVATGTPGGPMPSADFLKVVIGKRHDTAGTTNFFPGRIDEARIYNRALTATEVLALYNLGR